MLGWILLLVCFFLVGCTAPSVQPPKYAKLLDPDIPLSSPTDKLRPPTGACEQRVWSRGSGDVRPLPLPLDPEIEHRLGVTLQYLHPTAKRVLSRVEGVWPVENLKGASAVFLPCNMNLQEGTGGFVLVDVNAFPLDRSLRDAAVPALYWRTLAGGEARTRSTHSILNPEAPARTDHAIRYLLLHELGHALSLYAGEFDLDAQGRIRVTSMDGFAGYSWAFVTTEGRHLPLLPDDRLVRSVIPRIALDTVQWGSVLSVMDGEAAMIAPGYQLAERQDPMTRTLYLCAAAANLPMAGFVTPTAARYPTEDFAEVFAHAILADEGKIHPTQTVPIDLPLCEIKSLPSPYFSPSLWGKRLYMKQALGLRPRMDLPPQP